MGHTSQAIRVSSYWTSERPHQKHSRLGPTKHPSLPLPCHLWPTRAFNSLPRTMVLRGIKELQLGCNHMCSRHCPSYRKGVRDSKLSSCGHNLWRPLGLLHVVARGSLVWDSWLRDLCGSRLTSAGCCNNLSSLQKGYGPASKVHADHVYRLWVWHLFIIAGCNHSDDD